VHGAALAPTGDAVVLSAKTPGSEADNFARLYVTRWLDEEALWSAPERIEALDGEWNALAPFIGPDGRSLYFASERPGGLGGTDIWLSRRQGASWLDWSEPENLGPGVNSEQDETSLSVDASGGFAFMSAGDGSQQDIYEFGLPPNLSPAPTARVGGVIFRLGTLEPDEELPDGEVFVGEIPRGKFTGGGDGAEGIDVNEEAVVFVSMSSGETVGSARFNPVDGAYSTHLPVGDKYAAYVNVEGFAGIGQVLDLSASEPGSQLEQDLEVTELKEGATIRLNNVYFDTNQWELLEESRTELDRLVGILNHYPGMRIEIGGHTDSVDTDAHNLNLSTNRAAAVRDYLVNARIAPDRLESKGYGESRPMASNADEEGRQFNRRVEFTILVM
jgi:outer membrane protein OmpA-like peptidoglycan-associated protein